MNIGLVRRSLREIVPSSAVFALLLGVVSGLLAYALPGIQARFLQRGIPPGLRQFRDALLGVNTENAGVAEIAFSIAWSHPVVLALLLAQAIMTCTRVPAGEIERGTIDVLMALPVSRLCLFVSETVAWLLTGLLLLGSIFVGSYIGSRFIPVDYRPDFSSLAVVLVNMALVYTSIGATALLAASYSDRRTRAVLFSLVICVGSLLLNFLGPIWEPAKQFEFLSVLNYYRPINTLRSGQWPWKDLAVLAGATVTLWILAGWWFSRRDLSTT